MTRHVLIRRLGESEHLVAEGPLPAEASLHDALARYPELLPAEDLGLGRLVVVGRETALASGYADLEAVSEVVGAAAAFREARAGAPRSEAPETAPFGGKEQSRPALLLVVQSGRLA